ncbi:MAG: preprotein translocase subunit SecG [Bacteroidetes bacterium]|nr:preprotein translocase subunit SecG [Bacteroidota bacterium]
MYIFLTVIIIIACVLIILVVLVQNPKGSGLGATFGGSGGQLMGVQRTTDFLEKATWTLAVVLLVLSLLTTTAIEREGSNVLKSDLTEQIENLPPVPGGAPPPVQP